MTARKARRKDEKNKYQKSRQVHKIRFNYDWTDVMGKECNILLIVIMIR